ncbi:MAG: 50S ribosomal protein L3 [Candidatus Dadabacteria bacterium]|nr:MAG: 50S ribosomal protein L3 [Candidatus Dadabacteria bacterium]
MALGLLAKKIGMTRVFDENGRIRPVTILKAGPCRVLRHRTVDVDGYSAVQLGFEVVRPDRISKPMRGVFQSLGTDTYRHVAEFRAEGELPEVGAELGPDLFEKGALVNVRARTRGRGFAGVQKRHGFGGGRASHGSNFHRAPGSIGTASTPGHVKKGRKLPGQYGNKYRTIRNLVVVDVMPEEQLLLVEGGVPGAPNTLVRIEMAG